MTKKLPKVGQWGQVPPSQMDRTVGTGSSVPNGTQEPVPTVPLQNIPEEFVMLLCF